MSHSAAPKRKASTPSKSIRTLRHVGPSSPSIVQDDLEADIKDSRFSRDTQESSKVSYETSRDASKFSRGLSVGSEPETSDEESLSRHVSIEEGSMLDDKEWSQTQVPRKEYSEMVCDHPNFPTSLFQRLRENLSGRSCCCLCIASVLLLLVFVLGFGLGESMVPTKRLVKIYVTATTAMPSSNETRDTESARSKSKADESDRTTTACSPADQHLWETDAQYTEESFMNPCSHQCFGRGDCIAHCVSKQKGFTASCGQCFGDLATCTIMNCAFSCPLAPHSQSCADCVEGSCFQKFFDCAGFLPRQVPRPPSASTTA